MRHLSISTRIGTPPRRMGDREKEEGGSAMPTYEYQCPGCDRKVTLQLSVAQHERGPSSRKQHANPERAGRTSRSAHAVPARADVCALTINLTTANTLGLSIPPSLPHRPARA